MKVWIGQDDWYPIYTISSTASSTFDVEAEVPEEIVQAYKEAWERFEALQPLLQKLYRQGKEEKKR